MARSVLESLTSHIAVVAESGEIIAVNRAWREFAISNGADGNFNEGKNYFDACLTAFGDERSTALAVAEGIRDVSARRVPLFEREYPCHHDGKAYWYRCRISPFVGEGSNHVVVAHYDITHLKLTEEQLRFRERMLAQSQAMAHVGSWEVELTNWNDYASNKLRWSDECHRIFGYEPGEVDVTHALFFKSITSEDRARVEKSMSQLLNEGMPYRIELRIARPNGEQRVIQAWADVMRNTGNGVPRLLGTCQDITERKESEEALRKSAGLLEKLWHQLLRAQEDERRRIARELHDEIGQALTALMMNLQQLKLGVDDEDVRLQDSIEIVRQALNQVRGMALDLRPAILDDLGLIAALNWYVGRQAMRTGLTGRFTSDLDTLKAEPEIETTCFRIAQGALTNVARHARAKNFSIELMKHTDGFNLVIRDDGVGFDTESVFESVISGNSLGLAGMRERMEMIGGAIEFISEPGKGTEIQVHFPFSVAFKKERVFDRTLKVINEPMADNESVDLNLLV